MEAKSFENRKKPMRNATSRYQQGAQRVEDNSKSGDTLVLTFRVLKNDCIYMIEHDRRGTERHSFSFFLEVQTLSLEACTSAVAPLSDDFLSQSDATSTTTSHCSKHDHAVISPGTYCLHVIPVLVVLLFCMLRLTLGQMA